MAEEHVLYATPVASIESAATLCEIARPLLRAKARRLVRKVGFGAIDASDVEQEITLRLLQRFATCSTSKCPVLVFIKQVVTQSIACQARNHFAQKRDPCRVTSIDVSQGTPDSDEVEAEEPADLRTSMSDLAIDVEDAVSRLTADQQELCTALGISSISELARRFERPRATLQHQVRRVRRQFEDAGLSVYLD